MTIRLLTFFSIPALVGPLLACGGLGSGVASHTATLCDHLADTNEAPCSAVPFGRSVDFAGLEVVATDVQVFSASGGASYEDRAALNASGGTTLAVVLDITNPGPVKAGHDFGVSLYTADGELRMFSAGASETYAKQAGVATAYTMGNIGPGRTKRVAYVFAVPPSELSGATVSLQKVEYKPDPRDPRGRRRNFVVDQALIEVPDPAGS